jgi:parallel beta-helix repeat protein
MKSQILFSCVLIAAIFVWNSCNEQPTSVLDTQNPNSTVSKTVYIAGTDITEQLRNDLTAGLNVKLPEGHFYVSEPIVVQDYSGTVKGAGKDVTIIESVEGFQPVLISTDPLSEITAIFLILRSKGDVTFKDMTLLITGDAPAELHYNISLGMVTTTIDHGIAVTRVNPEAVNGITVELKNLRIKGEHSDDQFSVNNRNLAFALTATGKAGDIPVNTIYKNCEIDNTGFYAIGFIESQEGWGAIENNEISNSSYGIWLRDNLDGEIIVKNNRFNNIPIDPIKVVGVVSNYCFKNNKLDGAPMIDDCQ